GINPSNDGKVIRLSFPPLTEERRKELCKQVKKLGEEAKIAMRAIRRDAIEHFKAEKKKASMTEDDLKDAEKGIQEVTDKHIADVDRMVEAKDKEILEV
ncbi:MAG TPA: ribosome recycling factor, partial [Clostridiales bacterium]|nr:ribosome recycling factor [Clostridiales bacterium]